MRWHSLLLSACLSAGLAQAASDLSFESAGDVNEGGLHFLETAPAKPVHHHQNHIRIDSDSLNSGWVSLSQCHDHLDAVPRAQITFREGFVRDLKVDRFTHIEDAWIEGASVQLRNVEPGARLCLSAQTRALRNTGNGYFNLSNGPYMRKFLDGYYPMRVSLKVDYPAKLLGLLDITPPAQPGMQLEESTGAIRMEALFEGELQILIQFEKPSRLATDFLFNRY
ncbi:MAG: hypothetical protein ACSLEZ_11150 [Thiobacillus sp.]